MALTTFTHWFNGRPNQAAGDSSGLGYWYNGQPSAATSLAALVDFSDDYVSDDYASDDAASDALVASPIALKLVGQRPSLVGSGGGMVGGK